MEVCVPDARKIKRFAIYYAFISDKIFFFPQIY